MQRRASKRQLRNAAREIHAGQRERLEAGLPCQVFQLKANGQPYARPNARYQSGQTRFSREDAEAYAKQLNAFNPGTTWVVVEA